MFNLYTPNKFEVDAPLPFMMFPFTPIGKVSVKKFNKTHKYMGCPPCCEDCGYSFRVVITKLLFRFQTCPNCGALL